MNEEQTARGLGWFSLGLGTAGLLLPGRLAWLTGLRDDEPTRTITRLIGVRELIAGVGILTRPRPTGWVAGRVAADAVDLALTSVAFVAGPPRRERVALTLAALLGVAAVDTTCALRLGASTGQLPGLRTTARGIETKRAITVLKTPSEVYRFWRDFSNLPRFMNHLDSVDVIGDTRSHWRANAPAGRQAEWDAEIIEDRPNELISWRSIPGSGFENSGTVRFKPAPGDRGTEIHVELLYHPPAGIIGSLFAALFGEEPGQQVHDDLRRLKQVLETGQVTFSDATVKGMGPGQPPAVVSPKSPEENGRRLAASQSRS
jgi:uncharacterized membrane protein